MLSAQTILQIPAETPLDRALGDPTQLTEFATAPNAETKLIGTPESVVRGDTSVEIAAIEVLRVEGEREVGIRVSLERKGRSDTVYLDLDQARLIRSEFMQFVNREAPSVDCAAVNPCTHATLRCGRSQTVVQALCGVLYSTRDQELGVFFRTPRNEFRLPDVRAREIYEAFDLVIPQARRARRE